MVLLLLLKFPEQVDLPPDHDLGVDIGGRAKSRRDIGQRHILGVQDTIARLEGVHASEPTGITFDRAAGSLLIRMVEVAFLPAARAQYHSGNDQNSCQKTAHVRTVRNGSCRRLRFRSHDRLTYRKFLPAAETS